MSQLTKIIVETRDPVMKDMLVRAGKNRYFQKAFSREWFIESWDEEFETHGKLTMVLYEVTKTGRIVDDQRGFKTLKKEQK